MCSRIGQQLSYSTSCIVSEVGDSTRGDVSCGKEGTRLSRIIQVENKHRHDREDGDANDKTKVVRIVLWQGINEVDRVSCTEECEGIQARRGRWRVYPDSVLNGV